MTRTDETEATDFAVLAELEGESEPVVQVEMTLGQVFDQIVIPHEAGRPFIVAGRMLRRGENIRSLRIYRGKDKWMTENLRRVSRSTFRSKDGPNTMQQYHVQVLGVLNAHGHDVTAQVLTAYERSIKDKLADWLPNKKELTRAAGALLTEQLRDLGILPQ